MAIEFAEAEDQNDQGIRPLERTETSNTARRIRFATQKATGAKAANKRHSILRRLSHRNKQGDAGRSDHDAESQPDSEKNPDNSAAAAAAPPEAQQPEVHASGGRRLFFNLPLPDDARAPDGQQIAQYPRNKIRTAKYTPLSFVPKNLWFQFHNVANVYFLFVIILGVSHFVAPRLSLTNRLSTSLA